MPVNDLADVCVEGGSSCGRHPAKTNVRPPTSVPSFDL
jgi:hypothetical protein